MQPYYADNDVTLYHGDCRGVLPTLPAASVDAVVCDPPYPCVDRDYGYWTEDEWHGLMADVVAQLRRVLTPTGSAVLVLQPNSERLGRMRPWLWDFLAWAAREWGVVQDAYWWNFTAPPEAHAIQGRLLRPSLKMCVWLGPPDCHRNQEAVLWSESAFTTALRLEGRTRLSRFKPGRDVQPSGHGMNRRRALDRSAERGGVTPFNVLPLDNAPHAGHAGGLGHSAGTPSALCCWWIRYLTPPGGMVLDPFCGSGTVLRAAKQLGRRGIGIEAVEDYCRMAVGTLGQQALPLAV